MKKGWKIVIGIFSFIAIFYILTLIFPNANYEYIGEIMFGFFLVCLGFYEGKKHYDKKQREKKIKSS